MRTIQATDRDAVNALPTEFGEFGLPGRVWIPTRRQITGYGRKYKDLEPQHMSLRFARREGHPDLVAHGLLVLSSITLVRPEPRFVIEGVRVRNGTHFQPGKFRKFVCAGDEVHGYERVVNVLYNVPRRKFFLTFGFEVRIRSRDDALVVDGTYKVLHEF